MNAYQQAVSEWRELARVYANAGLMEESASAQRWADYFEVLGRLL